MNNFKLETLVLGALQTNCYIVYNDESKEAIVIDPADQVDKIINFLKGNDLVCKGIMLTHGHFDHILALADLKGKTGADVYAHEKEAELLGDPLLNASSQTGQSLSLKADVSLKDGQVLDLIGFNIKVIHTPGHTAGGVTYLFEEQNVLISGDTLFYGSIGRSDLPTGEGRVLIDSIKTKLMVLDEKIDVYPGHGSPTTIGFEKKHNQFLL